ncbi:Omp28-related outer membrane protein [Ancylomarina euxinus]|nr:Omp28-related outer membrane protein [Ancylomarina euxinus]MCZ4694851.1 Omp28-related outer membrane protein [Ancylomarina euxinus]
MKKHLILILSSLFLLSINLVSCSKSESNDSRPIVDNGSISITANKTSILADGKDEITFTVKDNNSKDITTESKIYVNGEAISGNTYTSKTKGEFTVKAVNLNRETSIKILVRHYTAKLYISSNRTSSFSSGSEQFEFKALDTKLNNVTSDTKFYVDDQLIDGHTFSSSTNGKHKVRAEYSEIKSADLLVGVNMSPRNVLVEDYTATWCGYCPESMYHLEELKSKTSANMVISAIHGSDEFQYSKIESLFSTFNITGYPTKIANRNIAQAINENDLISLVDESCHIGIKSTIQLDGNNAKIDVTLESYQTFTDIKLVVALCDNNQLADQSNYYNDEASSAFYKAGEKMKDFQHNYILRKTLTDLYGDAIPNDKLIQGTSYKLSFTTDVSKYNKAHLSAIAFLFKNGEVINVLSVDNL